MNTMTVTIDRGLDDMDIQYIQYIEGEFDLSLSEIGFLRVGSTKSPDKIQFHYLRPELN